MADEQPTEEQVQAANAAEEAKWEDDFEQEDLTVPTKTEDDEEQPEDTQEVVEDEEFEDPEPAVTTQDPGDFKPGDYSFKVTLASGKKVTIKTPEEAEEIGEDPDNFETPKQLMNFITKSQKMINGIDKDREKYEADKTEHDKQVATETERMETVNTFSAEFEYLADKGLLPKLSRDLQNSDWSDPEIAKNEDVQAYTEVLDYLVKENEVRTKAGIKPLNSVVDAFNAMQADTKRTKATNEKKAAGEQRKAAGARVAGVSPSQQGSYVPKGIAVGNPNIFKRSEAIWDN